MDFLNQKAIAILAHCQEPFKLNKLNNLKKLLTNLKAQNFFIFLGANSDIPQEIISLSDFYFQTKNWKDSIGRYGPSNFIKTEIVLKIAKYHGFKNILLNEYDAPFSFDYTKMYNFLDNKMKNLDVKFIGHHWSNNGVAVGIYMTEIDFLLDNFKFINFSNQFDRMGEIPTEQVFGKFILQNRENVYLYPTSEDIYREIDPSIKSSQKYQGGGSLEFDESTSEWKCA